MKRVLSWIDIIFGGLLIVYIIVINLISSNSIAFSTPLILLGILLIFYHIIKDKFNDNKFFKITRKVITTLVCLGLICFSIIEALIIGYPKNNKDNFDYLIVLGAGLKNKTEVSLTLEDRLKAAMECIKDNNDYKYIVVSGGKGNDERISEAEAMKNYLIEHGVLENKILIEDKSTNTSENLKFSKQIIEENSKKSISKSKIKVVTTDFHALRSSILAKKNGYKNIKIYTSDTIGYLIPIYYAREGLAVVKSVILD